MISSNNNIEGLWISAKCPEHGRQELFLPKRDTFNIIRILADFRGKCYNQNCVRELRPDRYSLKYTGKCEIIQKCANNQLSNIICENPSINWKNSVLKYMDIIPEGNNND